MRDLIAGNVGGSAAGDTEGAGSDDTSAGTDLTSLTLQKFRVEVTPGSNVNNGTVFYYTGNYAVTDDPDFPFGRVAIVRALSDSAASGLNLDGLLIAGVADHTALGETPSNPFIDASTHDPEVLVTLVVRGEVKLFNLGGYYLYAGSSVALGKFAPGGSSSNRVDSSASFTGTRYLLPGTVNLQTIAETTSSYRMHYFQGGVNLVSYGSSVTETPPAGGGAA